MNVFLLASFFLNAFISALIGLGGGTFYLVFLDLFRIDYRAIPFIALACNIAVSGISSGIRLWRGQREDLIFLIIILIPSMTSTYVGAQIIFFEHTFRLFLSIVVLCVLLFSISAKKLRSNTLKSMTHRKKMLLLFFISLTVGLLSGVIGIGGGIMLGPILYLLGMSYMDIPLITALYIFINSCVGIVSQFIKHAKNVHGLQIISELLLPYWPLVVLCACSGIISMYFGKNIKHERIIKNVVLGIIITLALYNVIRTKIVYGAILSVLAMH